MTTADNYFDDWVDDPPSQEIADILNATRASVCVHNRIECYVQCGVRRSGTVPESRWRVIGDTGRRLWRSSWEMKAHHDRMLEETRGGSRFVKP